MKIALVSTCALATPPHKYGGTELVVAELATGLLQLGHQVTTFATGDSLVPGRLRYRFATPAWPPNELVETRHACHAWREIAGALRDFDLVHLHHAAGLPFHELVPLPCVMTIHHTRVDELVEHYQAFPRTTYVAISQRQAALLPELTTRVIHHGLDPTRYPAGSGAGGYVAFLGRFSEEKAPHLAIDAARAAGMPLRMGGTYHHVAESYFQRAMQPRLATGDDVTCCGELGHEAKVALLREASAMLFPIQWEEPFGLVMIESMLVGTPVIGFRHGSAPEVIEEGVTGFLVDSPAEMAQRIGQLSQIDRKRCRARAQARWSSLRMAHEYAALYSEKIALHTEKVACNAARPAPSSRSATRTTGLHAASGAGVAMIQRDDPEACGTPRHTKELDHAATIRDERG
jgi:glycosyltransferase involved in cell wall biosynthesis